MKRKPLFSILLLTISLLGCSPREGQIQATVNSLLTQESDQQVPTNAPTPIPLKEIAFVDGDLPAGYELGVEFTRVSDSFSNLGIPIPIEYYARNALSDNYVAEIYVYVYESKLDSEAAYSVLSSGFESTERFGEVAVLSSKANSLFAVTFTNAVFLRCNIVVSITMPSGEEITENYAFRLDQRLENSYCG